MSTTTPPPIQIPPKPAPPSDVINLTIDGKAVAVKKTEVKAGPFKLVTVEIDSDRTGALGVKWDSRPAVPYRVKARTMPSEVTGVIGRYQGRSRPSEVSDAFDGLAIRLPVDTPAVIAEVIETGSHSASLAHVASGKADVAAIDCVSFALFRRHGRAVVQ